MTTPRKDRRKRRNLNSQEMHDLGFADLQANADEDGWAYPDDDDEETTEDFVRRDKKPKDRRRK